MPDRPIRLGDVIDDYCPRCRLLLNHDVASLGPDAAVAKVTCRTCYNTHDYRHAQVPPKRGKKAPPQKLFDQVLAGLPAPQAPPPAPAVPPPPVRKKRDLWAELERIKKK